MIWLEVGTHVGETVKPSVTRHIFLLQQLLHLLDALLKPVNTLVYIQIKMSEFLGQECSGKSHFQTAVAEAIQHGNVGGELQGVIKRGQDRASDHGGRLGVLACRRQEYERIWTVSPQ